MLECPACGHENADGAKFCNECAALLEGPKPAGREQRKTVTVLFCDVTGSTELGEKLDPEALRALLARYFERMKAIVERHGGTVEKFIGDAVMAVFGVPMVHEDACGKSLFGAGHDFITTILAHGVAHSAGEIELLAGEPEAAERELRSACEELQRIGDWGHFATTAPYLAEALLAQGRGEEAAPLIDLAAQWTLADDADAQIGGRRVRAKLIAQQGDLEEAERLARDAAARAGRTDYLNLHGRVLSDLAEVLALAGKPDEATDVLEQALVLYERKGNMVMAERTRARLAESRRS